MVTYFSSTTNTRTAREAAMSAHGLISGLENRIDSLEAAIERWQDAMDETSDPITLEAYQDSIAMAELEIHEIQTFLAS